MASINPAEYGVPYPTHLEPIAEFIPAAVTPDTDPLTVCDEGVRLFGLAAGETAVHSMAQPLEKGFPAQKYAGWIDL
jgi:hypothetical protein